MPGRRVSQDHSPRGGRAADMDLNEEQEKAPEEELEEEPEGGDGGEVASRLPAGAAAQAAIRAVTELVGKRPNGVTALEPTEDGWRVAVEVLEDERVPSSADILAIYEAELDMEGNLLAYRRTRRYQRGRADASGSR